MGCDINSYFEGLDNGTWYFLKQWDIRRSYQIFSKMSDGHGRGSETPISRAKGFPADISFVVLRMAEDWGSDFHSKSWLSSKELEELRKWFEQIGAIEQQWEIEKCRDYFINRLKFEDYRLVFAFDN